MQIIVKALLSMPALLITRLKITNGERVQFKSETASGVAIIIIFI